MHFHFHTPPMEGLFLFCPLFPLRNSSLAGTVKLFNGRQYFKYLYMIFVTVSGATKDGVESCVISVSCILAVSMEPAVNHGSVTVSQSGEDCFVMQVTMWSDLWSLV